MISKARAARLLLQLPQGCRTFVAVEPANQWGFSEVFLNKMVYYLETIVWQNGTPNEKGKRAKHMANKPKLFVPPFMQKVEHNKELEVHTVDEIKDILSKPRTQ